MSGVIQYSVLKYRHSIISGEVLNIGILFPLEGGRVEFHYPTRLSRISSLFDKFPLSFVKNTLSAFNGVAKKLSKNADANFLYYQNDFEKLISDNFLTVSSGVLFFGEIKQGVCSPDDEEILKQHFYKLYLSHYDEELSVVKNEKYILEKVKGIIKSKYPAVEQKLQVNKVLNDPHGNFNERFEYGWKNGKLNLITPIGFDLAKEQSFESKALKWSAILNFLREPAEEENINFDILLTEPKSTHLKKSFSKALDIIERSNAPVNFVEEGEYKQYLQHAVEVVLDHEQEEN